MPDWYTPPRPAELAESKLVNAILDGTFPANTHLPPERGLAVALGITRPTLREALQRLARDGWIEIHQGKPTRVKDIWLEGNLLILNSLAKHPHQLPRQFIPNLLNVRVLLAPTCIELALSKHTDEVLKLLRYLQDLPDTAQAYAESDYELQHQLAILTDNPVFALIYNGFGELFLTMGLRYFNYPEARAHSRSFYHELLDCCCTQNYEKAKNITKQVMLQSIDYWQKANNT